MPETPELGYLDSTEFNRVEEVASRFEQACHAAETVDLSHFLPPPGSPLRSLTLQELIKTELEVRWKRGRPVGLEYYAERFPELGGIAGLPSQLLYEEYRVRQLYGDRPQLDTYQNRFPAQFPELQRLLQQQPVQGLPPALQGSNNATPEHTLGQAARTSTPDRHVLPFGGGYTLIQRIGSGGFGEVWRAEAPGGVQVAIKIVFRPLDHAESQREQQALDLIKNLRHPFLLQTHSSYAEQDRLFIIMELADGSLRDRLKECQKAGQGGVPPQELLRYFLEAGEALDYLHESHVQHRDIKPENILLLRHHSKVADFGLAKLQEGSRMGTATGSGTPLYMAPEIWRGKVSQHSDQYSLALTYAELRLGRRVFASTDMMEVMFAHMQEQPEFPELPPAEAAVLGQALAKEPEQRFPSCVAFAEALHATFGSQLARTGGGLTGLGSTGNVSLQTPTATGRVPPTVTPGGITPSLAGAATQRGLLLPEAPPYEEVPPPRSLGLLAGGIATVLLTVIVSAALVAYYWPKPKPTTTVVKGPPTATEADGIPEGFKPDEGATLVTDDQGKKYYNKIAIERGGQRVVFCVVPRKREDGEPRTFYMMEMKVWNDLFKVAIQDSAFQAAIEKWRKSPAPWTVREKDAKWNLEGNGRLPVTNVTVTEAWVFARWLCPKGNLPLLKQWNKAAGYFDVDPAERGQTGPFKAPWIPPGAPGEIGLNRDSPLPVGMATKDISIYEIHDMAGNGLEWTCNISGEDSLVPLSAPMKSRGYQVWLRGRSFTRPLPLVFADLDGPENLKRDVQLEKYEDAKDDVSFRVVVEP